MGFKLNTLFIGFVVFLTMALIPERGYSQELSVLVPNIFTPNNDGRNDLFTFTGTGIASVSCKVYNRNGLLIYEWNSVAGGWDGRTVSGERVTEGVYFFIAEIKGQSGETQKKSGSVSLIR